MRFDAISVIYQTVYERDANQPRSLPGSQPFFMAISQASHHGRCGERLNKSGLDAA